MDHPHAVNTYNVAPSNRLSSDLRNMTTKCHQGAGLLQTSADRLVSAFSAHRTSEQEPASGVFGITSGFGTNATQAAASEASGNQNPYASCQYSPYNGPSKCVQQISQNH